MKGGGKDVRKEEWKEGGMANKMKAGKTRQTRGKGEERGANKKKDMEGREGGWSKKGKDGNKEGCEG